MIKLQVSFKDGVESWELSTRKEEPSIVANGEDEGKNLLQYIAEQDRNALGTKSEMDRGNPIYIQVIEDKNEVINPNIKVMKTENIHIEMIDIEEEVEWVVDETSFHGLIVLEGSSHILSSREKMTLNKGDIIFLPAEYGTYCIVGTCKVMLGKMK